MQIVLVASLLIVVALVVLAAWAGAFRPVRIEERTAGPFTLVFRGMEGTDMRRVAAITDALAAILDEAGLDDRRPLGVYHPDGRAQIGFAVEGAGPDPLAALARRDDVEVEQVPARPSMVTSFPWKSPLSYLVAFLKVNPALARHRRAHGYRKTEALSLHDGDRILFSQPIAEEA